MGHGGPFSVISTKIHIITRGLPRVLVGRWLLRSTPGNPRAGFGLEIRISAFFGVAGLGLESNVRNGELCELDFEEGGIQRGRCGFKKRPTPYAACSPQQKRHQFCRNREIEWT